MHWSCQVPKMWLISGQSFCLLFATVSDPCCLCVCVGGGSNLDVSFLSEHTTDIYSPHFDQLWVCVLITMHCTKELFCWVMRVAITDEYRWVSLSVSCLCPKLPSRPFTSPASWLWPLWPFFPLLFSRHWLLSVPGKLLCPLCDFQILAQSYIPAAEVISDLLRHTHSL